MIRRVLECESCKKQFDIPDVYLVRPYDWKMPESWLTLVEGDPQTTEAWHFCSRGCLRAWLDEEKRA